MNGRRHVPIVVQFQNIQGSGLEQYMTGHKQVIVYPPEYKDGEIDAAIREIEFEKALVPTTASLRESISLC